MNFAIYFSLVFLLSGLTFFGFIVCVTGVVIQWISIIQLDRAFTVVVVISRR